MTSALLINLTLLAAIIGIANSVGLYEQCAGDGYGTFPCNAGLTCFRRNAGFSSCQFSCPRNQGWDCEIGLPVGPVTTIAAGWDQCGGDGWYGPAACEAGYGCYARSVFYSQCRPIGDCPAGWTCPVTPITIAAGGQCGGNGWAGASVCAAGYGCYAQNALYSQCRPIGDCPTGWTCTAVTPITVAAGGQCGGNGWAGASVCAAGYGCYAQNALYSQCRLIGDCPAGWACTPVTPITIAAGFGQCGGSGWAGASVCASGYGCYAQNALYSQCRPFGDCPAGWSCTPVIVPTTVSPTVGPTGPVILDAYSQCNNVGYAVCAAGTGCFRNNANYAECRPYCPVGWACETDVALVNGQCGGQNYVGTTRCAAGLACYAQNAIYSQCRPVGDCPTGWACTPIIVSTTAYPTVGPTGPVILAVNSQCNNVGNAVCPAGTGCFRSTAIYAECRYYCPVGWACETDVAGINEQCGGQNYVGITRCAAGYGCYAQNAIYSQCRPIGDCPAGWDCTAIIVPTTVIPTVIPTVSPTGPVILGVNSQCNNVGNAACPVGTGCFRSTAIYSECRYYCPVGWACETDVAGANEQCGGQDYVGITRCAAGYACYAQNGLYSQCRPVGDCPAGWDCTAIIVPTTAIPTVIPTVSPTGPVILGLNSQCNNVGNAACPVGTGCFRSTAIYSECRYYCPVGWACETDVAGANEQCGGENFVGITQCAAGLTCYARSKYFSHCAAECPGVGWLC